MSQTYRRHKGVSRKLLVLLAVCAGLLLAACTASQGSTSTSAVVADGSGFEGPIGSWTGGGTDASTAEGDDYAYSPALYVTADGVDAASAFSRISGGSYDDAQATGIAIDDSASGHNGLIVNNVPYTLSNATIIMNTDADGTNTCDFSGKGTAVAAFGENADVTVEDSTIDTSGVATMALFIDSGATLTCTNSTVKTQGGTLYTAYQNTPDQAVMVAPPWVLGIMGTARTSNLMGDGSTLNMLDSDVHAGSWGIFSTDSGSDVHLNVIGTTASLDNAQEDEAPALQAAGGQITQTLNNPYTTNSGSGYGSYAIGNADELFAGSTLNVGTYATIFTGGAARYTALQAGTTYSLTNAAGETTATYTAMENKVCTINSDTFGFMAHQGSNTLTVEKGTVVNSGYATFLVKSGSASESIEVTIDDADISNGGVLIQVMDNDDATTSSDSGSQGAGADSGAGSGAGGAGASSDAGGGDAGSGSGGAAMVLADQHNEDAGFNTDAAESDGTTQDFTFTNGAYSGNIYNASGSDGLDATTLNVTLGSGATLTGAAAATSAIHVTYDGSTALKNNGCDAFDSAEAAAAFASQYQNTSFSIDEYFSMGHVANLVCDNGGNAINVTLTDDAVWNVTATSAISTLSVSGNARVVVPQGVTLTVGDTVYTGCTVTA